MVSSVHKEAKPKTLGSHRTMRADGWLVARILSLWAAQCMMRGGKGSCDLCDPMPEAACPAHRLTEEGCGMVGPEVCWALWRGGEGDGAPRGDAGGVGWRLTLSLM